MASPHPTARLFVALSLVAAFGSTAMAASPSRAKRRKKSDARVSASARAPQPRPALTASTVAVSPPPPAAAAASAPAIAPAVAPPPLVARVEPLTPAAVDPQPRDDGPPPSPPGYAFDAQRPPVDTVSGARGTKDAPEARCLIGNFCVGPVVALGAVNAFGIGAHGRYGRYFGIGFDYQATPRIGGESLKIGTTAYTVAARVYPFGNGLFVSAGIGGQTVRVHATDTGVGVDATAQATGVALGIGYMGSNGLIIGIDASVLVPLQTATVSIVGVTGVPSGLPYLVARSRAAERANAIAQSVPVVPQVNLLRVGYLF